MSPHFRAYSENLVRLRLVELIADARASERRRSMRASLIFNPCDRTDALPKTPREK